MDTESPELGTVWAPSACALPTQYRPLRLAEFEDLFARSLRGVDRYESSALRLELDPAPEAAAQTAD